jgi:diguanylate cyclase (GGDEF)-like protein
VAILAYGGQMRSAEPAPGWLPAPPTDQDFDDFRDTVFYRRLPLALDSIVRARTVQAVAASIVHGASFLWPDHSARLEDVAMSLAEQMLVDELPGHVSAHGRSIDLRRRIQLRRCNSGVEAVALLGAHETYLGQLVITPPGPDGWLVRQERDHLRAYTEVCSAALHSCLAIAELRRLALTDQLTGLPNRRALDHRLEQADRAGMAFGLIFCDANDLGRVNNELGYDAGNAVITALAAAISAALDDSEFAARMGGDEFICLTTADAADGLAARIEQRFSAMPIGEAIQARSSGISIGVVAGSPDEPARDLLRRGAEAMRTRKTARKAEAGAKPTSAHSS